MPTFKSKRIQKKNERRRSEAFKKQMNKKNRQVRKKKLIEEVTRVLRDSN